MLTVAAAATAHGCRYNGHTSYMLTVVAAAIGRSCLAGIKADVQSSSRGIFDNRTRHLRGNSLPPLANIWPL